MKRVYPFDTPRYWLGLLLATMVGVFVVEVMLLVQSINGRAQSLSNVATNVQYSLVFYPLVLGISSITRYYWLHISLVLIGFWCLAWLQLLTVLPYLPNETLVTHILRGWRLLLPHPVIILIPAFFFYTFCQRTQPEREVEGSR